MATRTAEPFTLPSGADFSGKTGPCFGKQSSGAAIPCSTLGEQAFFIVNNSPISGATAECMPDRGVIVEITVGAASVAQDDELTTDANGYAKTAVSTNWVRCKALSAGAAGAQIRALWVDAYAKS